ncbi:amp binding protein [Lentinula edodes]|uniref:Amp binding protein n=1 Tax=Lentinula edodes TaxID=5353 RepID=A0A1Q3DW82_LENED|nr:amp binding protein [Lentinula edodes]
MRISVFLLSITGSRIGCEHGPRFRQDLRTLSLKFGYGLRHDPRVKAQRGDVVLVFSPNSLQYPVYILGAIAAGMRCTLTNNAYTARELQHQYIDSGATMIITTSENLSVALEMLIGVETTHQNLTTATETIDLVLGYKAGDRLLIFLPFYHIYGAVSGLLFPIFCGTTTVIMARFDLIDFCVAVERYRITAVLVVPPVMLAIARHPAIDKFDLSSIWLLFSSAAPVSPTLIKEAKKRLLAKRKPEEPLYITEGYGMTECSPASHILPLDSSVLKMGSVGVLLPNYQARLVADDSGETEVDAEEGIPGELWLKGPSVMKGYLNNLTANKDSFTADRWYKTGDICVRDKEGFYFIVDRKKELIKYKGFQGSVLITHPEVADAAVIGVHNENDMTELPRAYVVHTQPAKIFTSESKNSFEKSVAKWMESKVARHKYLRGGVMAIGEIPRSAAGKILRRELRGSVPYLFPSILEISLLSFPCFVFL